MRKSKKFNFWAVGAALISILIVTLCVYAGTIRHDRNDGDYIALAEQYPSVGYVYCGTESGSGTLITPNYVLTAAHVVNEFEASNIYFYIPEIEASIQVATKYIYPGFVSHDFNDIALLRLSQTILDITPSELYVGTTEVGNLCIIVGYGRTGTGLTGATEIGGTKRAGHNMIDTIDFLNGYLKSDFDHPDNALYSSMGSVFPVELEYCFAKGDSGGAVFMDDSGVVKLAGINSYIYPYPVPDLLADSDYGDQMFLTRVSSFVPWINSIISAGVPDGYEADDTNSQANFIYNNEPQTHSISPADDIDWLVFSVSVESEVLIETTGTSGDTRMWLKDSDLFHIEYDDNDGDGLFSRIDRTCDADPLPAGIYYIKIDSKDNNHEIPTYNIYLTVTPCTSGNHKPQLTNGYVNPGTGTISTNFSWSVHYEDEDGDSPETKNVYIDGSPHTMTLNSGLPSNGTYSFGPLTLGTGNHNYYFYFTDGNGGSKRLPIVGTLGGPQVSDGGSVYFADPNLKAAVEAQLGGITNPTPDDMLNLTWLNASNKGITDLTGLEYAINLEDLNLWTNNITDLSPLSGLTELQDLNLGHNHNLTFIDPLAGLTNLVELDLYANDVYDLTPLSGLINLTRLTLYATEINYDDLPALSGLINLTELELWGNDLSDISALSTLVNLEILDLSDNQIGDISPLSELTNLTYLDLRTNPLNTASYCIYIPLITANNPGIGLYRDPNPDPGAECPVYFADDNLKAAVEEVLLLSNPTPTDMLALTNLDASFREVVNLVGLETATSLTSLYLNGNLISDISPLSGLSNLTELYLYGNHLFDISPVSGLTNLTQLYLNGNQITDITCLSGHANLTSLWLGGNQISDISSLSGLSNLTYLELYSNPLNIAAYCTYLPLILTNNPGIDLDYDSKQINFLDFAIFAEQWNKTNCGICDGVDLDQDNDVDEDDLLIFCNNWLGGADTEPVPEPEPNNWSAYLGGTSADAGWYHGITVDDNGNAFIAGYTYSDDFANAVNARHGSDDAFVAKLDPNGTVQWARYLGGSDTDQAFGVATDSSGNVFVTGYTLSSDFNDVFNSYSGGRDSFIAKITSAGSLAWARYLGGTALDSGTGIAIDSSGNIFVTGGTQSSDFTGALNSQRGSNDAYVAKITSAGSVDWMIYLGGTASDGGENIAFDESGNLVIVGMTNSSDLDVASNSYYGGPYDAFVSEVSKAGSVNWSTYIGGSSTDFGLDIATDTSGNSFLTGPTNSTNLVSATNTYYGGDYDAFVAKITTTGSLVWSVYLGGSAGDDSKSIALDTSSNMFVTGKTSSSDFIGATNNYYGGSRDAFITELTSDGLPIETTYFGGTGEDWANGIALYQDTRILIEGMTSSTDFVYANNSYYGGGYDGFITHVGGDSTPPPTPSEVINFLDFAFFAENWLVELP